MNKRNRNLITIIFTASLILSNILPIFGGEIVEDTIGNEASYYEEIAEISSYEGDATIDSVDITYPDGDYTGLPHPFSVVCDSDKGVDHSFARVGNTDEENPVILVSYTNGYEENLALTAVNKNAKSLRIYNESSIRVSSENSPHPHTIAIEGYNGHGEEFYINRNMLDITDNELNNLKFGELKTHKKNNMWHYYEPILGVGIFTQGYHSFDPITNEEFRLTLSVSMDIVHDTYNPLDETDTTPQTWIRVRYTGVEKKEVVGSEVVDSEVVPEWC